MTNNPNINTDFGHPWIYWGQQAFEIVLAIFP
jgi:hypothetical protein